MIMKTETAPQYNQDPALTTTAGKAITSIRIDALTLIIYASIHHPSYNLDYTSHAN
jgi:hypothetical protein